MQGPDTRGSLIGRLQNPEAEAAWTEFVELYRPLIYRVARAKRLQHADAEDLAQDVLAVVRRAIQTFNNSADGSFRGWLFTITRNLCVNHLTRRQGPLGSGDTDVQRMLQEYPADEETVTLFQLEHRRAKFRQAAKQLQSEFSEATWLSFWLTAVEQQSISAVAERLGKSDGAVRVARCRVLARLRTSLQSTDNED